MLLHLLSLLAFLAVPAWAADFHVNTPDTLVYGEEIVLSWTGGTNPFVVDLIRTGSKDGSVLKTLTKGTYENTIAWTVDVSVGTSVTISVKDASSTALYSSGVMVLSAVNSSSSSAYTVVAASSTIAAQASPSLVSAPLVAAPSSAETSPPTSAGSTSAGASSDTLTSTQSATREMSASGSSSVLLSSVSPASLEDKAGQKTGGLSISSKGGIIGGVLGAATVVGALAAFIYLCRRRRQRQDRRATWLVEDDNNENTPSHIALAPIDPFFPPASPPSIRTQSYTSPSQAHSVESLRNLIAQPVTSTALIPASPIFSPSSPPSAGRATTNEKHSAVRVPTEQDVQPVVEVDGGPVVQRTPTYRLPPTYDPTWTQRD